MITPRRAIPNGIANIHPLPILIAVDDIIFVSLSSGEYVPVIGEVLNQLVINGKAVMNTATMSIVPSSECELLPIAAKISKDIVSMIASSGLSNGV